LTTLRELLGEVVTMARTIVVTSVVDAVTEDLSQLVLKRDLAPGALITEQLVAEQYEVARATARAAIERLVAAKVLTRKSHKSARVVTLGPDDVRDIYNTRIYLESEILRRLAGRQAVVNQSWEANREIAELWSTTGTYDIVNPDMRFHTALVDSIHSPRTSAVYSSLAFEVKLCMSQLQGSQRLSPDIIIAEHSRLLELIAEGDGTTAASLLNEHLSRARELLVGSLGGVPGPEADWPVSVFGLPPAS
jgi:DNA-binding GntR family transcriptional regulator